MIGFSCRSNICLDSGSDADKSKPTHEGSAVGSGPAGRRHYGKLSFPLYSCLQPAGYTVQFDVHPVDWAQDGANVVRR